MQKMDWLRISTSAIVLWLATSSVALAHQLVEQFPLIPESETLIETQTFEHRYNEMATRLGIAPEYILPEIQMESQNQWRHHFFPDISLTTQCKGNPHQISEIVLKVSDTSVYGQLSLSLISLVIIFTLSDQLELIEMPYLISRLIQDAYDQGEVEFAIYGISYTMKYRIGSGFGLFINPTSAIV